MIPSARELYAYSFYRLRRLAKAIADDNLHDWKALLVLVFAQGLFFYGLSTLVEAYFRRAILPSDPMVVAAPLGIGLTALNYFLLLHKDKWRRYEKAFNGYSAGKQRTGGILVLLSIATAIGLFVLSLYVTAHTKWDV